MQLSSTARTDRRAASSQPRPRRATEGGTALLFLAPALTCLGLFVFWPLLRSLYLSVFLTDPLGRPKLFVGLANFTEAFASPVFRGSLGTTLLFVLLTVPTGVALALGLALLADRKLKGIRLFQMIFASPLAISVSMGATIFSLLYHPLIGLFNLVLKRLGLPPIGWTTDPAWALFAVGLCAIWLRLGFNFVTILSGLQNVPRDLYEAAQVDGASGWRQHWHVTLPMISPTLFFTVVVGVIHALQTFGEVQILTGGGPSEATNLIVYQIYSTAFERFEFGTASAQSLILFALMLLCTWLQFRVGERRVHYQ
jgi:sn-glycerol 3-phosphate transport system permease protein